MLAIFYCMTFFLNKQINCSKRFQNFNVQSFSLILGIGIKARIPFYPSCPSARKNKKISSSCSTLENRSTCKYFMNYYFCKNLLSSNLYKTYRVTFFHNWLWNNMFKELNSPHFAEYEYMILFPLTIYLHIIYIHEPYIIMTT